MATSNKLISVQHLVKEYNHGTVKALNDCNLDIAQGEVVAIIGPSGSGKSTLLRSLNLLEEPTGGQIFFDGVDLADKSVDINLHRQKMGMVFQHFNLFPHKTVLQNITMAPLALKKKTPEEAQKQAMELLELMRSLAKEGMTMAVVTHEMGFAREVADRVVFMAEGKILEEGSPAELFDSPKDPRLQDFLSKVL